MAAHRFEPGQVVICAARRTPIGAFMGALSALTAPQLGATALGAVLDDAGLPREQVAEVLLGHVLSAGCGQAPARQAARAAGLPDAVGATGIHKVCGSGLKAIMQAALSVAVSAASGSPHIVAAGGMESMSRVPFLLPEHRSGRKLGHAQTLDALLHDGLTDAYGGMHMGVCAERTAERYGVSRAEMDAFTRQSYARALAAHESGAFAAELVPITCGKTRVERDEEPQRYRPDKVDTLTGAFESGGAITAANSSSLNDGAAALLLTTAAVAAEHGAPVLARVLAQAGTAGAPEWFTTAPVAAIRELLDTAGLSVADIGLWEINEAFAVVSMVAATELGIPEDRLNIHGGAVALGHPIGASGARILVTLIHALRARRERYGVAAICIGGGEGLSLLVENPGG
ncbi:MAG: thiolase family protein [Nitrospirota bacterium]|nr:thiolase family protein [Nitrospirota bacterium]